jgi:long-chain acyl-CoA synthetase
MSFRELNRYVNRLANALLASGLKKGDKLTTVLPNCLELMAAFFAAGKTGIVVVPASPMLQDTGLATLIDDSDTAMVIADATFAATFERMRGSLPKVAADRVVLVGGDGGRAGCRSYASLIAGASEDEPPDADIRGDDVYDFMYSSGTNGSPKGIVHTHDVRGAFCWLFASTFRIAPESIVLHAGSIVFNGAWIDLMPWIFVGGTYILHEAFSAERVIETIEREKVTHVIMVPSQIIAVLSSPSYDPRKLESLEMLQSIGAPLLLEHKRRLTAELPGRFYELYGLTEGMVTILDKHVRCARRGQSAVRRRSVRSRSSAPTAASARRARSARSAAAPPS